MISQKFVNWEQYNSSPTFLEIPVHITSSVCRELYLLTQDTLRGFTNIQIFYFMVKSRG
jgi:hypothetical protein